MLEYQYFTNFEFPNEASSSLDLNRNIDIDSHTKICIANKQGEKGCLFTLSTTCSVENIANHDPTKYELYAIEHKHLYNVVRLSLAYLTGHLVSYKTSNVEDLDLSAYEILPNISHNFYEIAKESGFEILPKKGRKDMYATATLYNPLSTEKIELLSSIVRGVKSDETKSKYDVLEYYFKGFIDRSFPYFHWYKILETCKNPKIGFISLNHGDYLKLGEVKIDLKFLRLYAHCHRHSHLHRNWRKNWNELATDPIRSKYTQSSYLGRKYYETNIRYLIEHFILRT